MNWDDHLYHRRNPVRVRFTPRPFSPDGDELKPGLGEHIGKELLVVAYWYMGDDDPYPGEWALGTPHLLAEVLPEVSWVASGDVTVIQESEMSENTTETTTALHVQALHVQIERSLARQKLERSMRALLISAIGEYVSGERGLPELATATGISLKRILGLMSGSIRINIDDLSDVMLAAEMEPDLAIRPSWAPSTHRDALLDAIKRAPAGKMGEANVRNPETGDLLTHQRPENI